MENRVIDARLASAYEAARNIMNDKATSFYFAFSKLAPEKFSAIAALYAFCRYADDLVDAGGQDRENAARLLLDLENAVRDMDSEKPYLCHQRPWWPAFFHTVLSFNIEKESFFRQIEGQRTDLSFQEIKSEQALIDYGRLVAGSVGRMLAPLIARDENTAKNPAFLSACEGLGIGMQLSNILRDIGEDLRLRGRVYIPSLLLFRHGLTREDLLSFLRFLPMGDKQRRFADLWEELSSLAKPFYQGIEDAALLLHPACRVSTIAAARIYHAIEDAVRESGYDCFQKRNFVSLPVKQKILQESAETWERVEERSVYE